MIVKLTPIVKDPTWARVIEEKYARECLFYSVISRDAGVRMPFCYFAAYQPDPPRFVLLLEDLGAARFGDAAVGWSVQEAEMVVDALAGLHARWWNHSSLDQWTWIPPYGDVTAQLEKIRGRRATFLQRYGMDLSPELTRATARIGSQHSDELRRLGGPPNTILHGDVHLDNIAFLDGPASTAVLFDWQTLTKGLGAVDLALFMLGGSPAERRRHERHLIERYHGRLVAGGVTGYSFDTLLADFRVALLRWWIGTVNGLGSPYAAAWTGRQAHLALQSVKWWNAMAADHQLSELMVAE
jgi:thiamine kinase-like enzyme